jgi:hypothetical protein
MLPGFGFAEYFFIQDNNRIRGQDPLEGVDPGYCFGFFTGQSHYMLPWCFIVQKGL